MYGLLVQPHAPATSFSPRRRSYFSTILAVFVLCLVLLAYSTRDPLGKLAIWVDREKNAIQSGSLGVRNDSDIKLVDMASQDPGHIAQSPDLAFLLPGSKLRASFTLKPTVNADWAPGTGLSNRLRTVVQNYNPLPKYTLWSLADRIVFDIRPRISTKSSTIFSPFQRQPTVPKQVLSGMAHAIEQLEGRGAAGFVWSGTVSDITTGDVLFDFKTVILPFEVTLDTRRRAINERDLRDIGRTKVQILEKTTENDLVIFLGNSASFFYYSFTQEDRRNVRLIPMSGNPFRSADTSKSPNPLDPMISSFSDHGPPPPKGALDSYTENVLKPAFSLGARGIFKQSPKRVVIVDASITGGAIRRFSKILALTGTWTGETAAIELKRNAWPEAVDLGRVKPLGSIHFSGFDDFLFSFFGRIVPFYPANLWYWDPHEVPNADAKYVEENINTIQSMHSTSGQSDR
ncbi:MAG: hypothetical protein M1825_002812 [Sarcosagium campestre]|nr:MAG: hypothetical protein M1825_002812 [Sarcosagium campestre]